jgi:hypothetical protein
MALTLVPSPGLPGTVPSPRLPLPDSAWGSPDLKMAVACIGRGWSPADLAARAPGVAAEMRALLKQGVTQAACRAVLGWDKP